MDVQELVNLNCGKSQQEELSRWDPKCVAAISVACKLQVSSTLKPPLPTPITPQCNEPQQNRITLYK